MQIYADTKNLWSGKNVDLGLNDCPCVAPTVAATNNCLKRFIFCVVFHPVAYVLADTADFSGYFIIQSLFDFR